MKPDFYVEKENHGRKEEAFVVRDKQCRFQAAFAFENDAELFATMKNCMTCEEDVSNHARLRGHRQNVNEQATLRRTLDRVNESLNESSVATLHLTCPKCGDRVTTKGEYVEGTIYCGPCATVVRGENA